LWIYDLSNGTGIQVGYSGEGSGDDPKFSPNGEYISFIRNHGLAVVPLRVREGDDASCLNLYKPLKPRVMGVPNGANASLSDRGWWSLTLKATF
jgi:Tol biopolymer transport system component